MIDLYYAIFIVIYDSYGNMRNVGDAIFKNKGSAIIFFSFTFTRQSNPLGRSNK